MINYSLHSFWINTYRYSHAFSIKRGGFFQMSQFPPQSLRQERSLKCVLKALMSVSWRRICPITPCNLINCEFGQPHRGNTHGWLAAFCRVAPLDWNKSSEAAHLFPLGEGRTTLLWRFSDEECKARALYSAQVVMLRRQGRCLDILGQGVLTPSHRFLGTSFWPMVCWEQV